MTISQTRLRKLRELERRKAKTCGRCLDARASQAPETTPCPDCREGRKT
jgi:hypothetical protein